MERADASVGGSLSGAEKAAILLLKLGSERSAKVLKLLGESEVTQITAEIVQGQPRPPEDSDGALAEFATLVKASDHCRPPVAWRRPANSSRRRSASTAPTRSSPTCSSR